MEGNNGLDVEKSIKRIKEMWPTKGNVSPSFLLRCLAYDSPEPVQKVAKEHLIEMLRFAKKERILHYYNYTDFMFFFLKDDKTTDMVMKSNIMEVLKAIRFPF
ncbi:MAG: hypothetical protein GXO97_08185 [Nitrospirae bacterium]|nr:hypothetical protein [Nitrospirota bacterium]